MLVALVAGLTSIYLTVLWGGLNAPTVWHDEAAYLLQAKLFSRGEWCAPGASMPDFFAQYHVVVTPFLAAKYPPGQALSLVPGIWLGVPGLMPVLLGGLTGALIFVLARAISGTKVGLLTWLIWAASPLVVRFEPSYMSEVTSAAALCMAWGCLQQYLTSKNAAWLSALAGLLGWCGLTRPLTALAVCVPIVVVALPTAHRQRQFRFLFLGVGVAVGILSIGAFYNRNTTGDWTLSPYRLYTEQNMPWDRPGFGLDTTAPTLPQPPEMGVFARSFEELHRAHRVSRLGAIAFRRSVALAQEAWGLLLPLLAPMAMLGLAVAPRRVVWFGVATLACSISAYLIYAHPLSWSVYYLEVSPFLAYFAAAGLAAVIQKFEAGKRQGGYVVSGHLLLRRAAWVLCLGGLLILSSQVTVAIEVDRQAARIENAAFAKAIETIRDSAIVFVDYGPQHVPHRSLIQAKDDLSRERLWTVHDLGARNSDLTKAFPNRKAYRYIQSNGQLVRYTSLPMPIQ